MSVTIASPAAFADWLSMLDRIERSVAVALHEADRRESAAGAGDAADDLPARDGKLRAGIDETIRGLEVRLSAARELAARVEAMLDADESVVRNWQSAATTARQRLAALDRLS